MLQLSGRIRVGGLFTHAFLLQLLERKKTLSGLSIHDSTFSSLAHDCISHTESKIQLFRARLRNVLLSNGPLIYVRMGNAAISSMAHEWTKVCGRTTLRYARFVWQSDNFIAWLLQTFGQKCTLESSGLLSINACSFTAKS